MKFVRSRILIFSAGCCLFLMACEQETARSTFTEKAIDPIEWTKPKPIPEARAEDVKQIPSEPAADEHALFEQESGYPPIDQHFEIPKSWIRLGPSELWIDREKHQVIVGGHVCMVVGPLEMFACPEHTKEHESIVATHTSSRFVHAALLAVGAKPGTPVQFDEEYKPAKGPKVKVLVRWNEDGKLREKPAQQMVRNIATKKPMEHDWLFVGSGFWKNPDTGEDIYLGDSGELICVSNFGSATMDLPVESSSAAAGLLFEANTENIPMRGTLVLLVLEPEVSPESEPAKEQEKAASDEKPDPTSGKAGK